MCTLRDTNRDSPGSDFVVLCRREMEAQGNPLIKTGSVATASVLLVSCGLGSNLVNESKKVSCACR